MNLQWSCDLPVIYLRQTFSLILDACIGFCSGFDVVNFDSIPNKGGALLVLYHGALPLDFYYLWAKVQLMKRRSMYMVADRFMWKIPGKKNFSLWYYRQVDGKGTHNTEEQLQSGMPLCRPRASCAHCQVWCWRKVFLYRRKFFACQICWFTVHVVALDFETDPLFEYPVTTFSTWTKHHGSCSLI